MGDLFGEDEFEIDSFVHALQVMFSKLPQDLEDPSIASVSKPKSKKLRKEIIGLIEQLGGLSKQLDPSSGAEDSVLSIQKLLAQLSEDPSIASVSKPKSKKLRKEIIGLIEQLGGVSKRLDPISEPDRIFDPSDPNQMGKLIASALLEYPKCRLTDLPRFYGSGIYAIYYIGDFDVYAPIRNTETPIYVGKVDPLDPSAQKAQDQGDKLYKRLTEDHQRSIVDAQNLNIEDFECRYLVVNSGWQNMAEKRLIEMYMPVWNSEAKVCYGIGKHGDKSRTNTRSPWDMLHPGREKAGGEINKKAKTSEQVKNDIIEHFKKNIPLA
jgi:hypothetical protein